MSCACRQVDDEPGALELIGVCRIDNIFRRQRAAMGLDDLAADRKTETGILAESLRCRTIRVETFEDAFDILNRNARTVILDKHAQAAAFTAQRHHDTPGIVGHERTGIFNQVAHHLTETQIVTGNIETLLSGGQLAGIEDDFRSDLVAAHFARCRHEVGQKRLHVDAVDMFARKFSIKTRSVRNVGNQAVEAANVVLDDIEKPFARFLSLGERQRFDGAAQRGEGFFAHG